MRGLLAKIGLAAAVFAAPLLIGPVAFAQGGAIQQAGPVTAFHVPAFFQNGVVGDGGTSGSPFINSLNLFNGQNTPFSISSQTGPGTTTSAAAQFSVTVAPTQVTLNVNGINGQPTPSLYFNIGGTLYPFTGGGGGGGCGTSAPCTVAQGGTNGSSASGTLLDNITGFSGTGFLTRTGAGSYAFQSFTNGLTLGNLPQLPANTVLSNFTGSTANMTSNAVPDCEGANLGLIFTPSTGFGCSANNATAPLFGPTGVLCSQTAPTITSAGTSPAILSSNGTCAFTVNVGTGGTATAVVLALPTAIDGWTCTGSDVTTQSTSVFLQKQTASSAAAATITNYNDSGTATAFGASDHLRLSCMAD